MKSKKNILVLVIVALVAAGITADYIIMRSQGAGGPKKRPWGLLEQVLSSPLQVRNAIGRMIVQGSLAENITFTGRHSPDDVFGNGEMYDNRILNAKELLPPPAACSPPCSDWKYLPAAKKDYGWYVYGVGTPATDIIAYLPNITPAVCSQLQKAIGGFVSPIPPKQVGAPFDFSKPGIYSAKGSVTTIKSEDNTLDGQPMGCFGNYDGKGVNSFSYYSVLLGQ